MWILAETSWKCERHAVTNVNRVVLGMTLWTHWLSVSEAGVNTDWQSVIAVTDCRTTTETVWYWFAIAPRTRPLPDWVMMSHVSALSRRTQHDRRVKRTTQQCTTNCTTDQCTLCTLVRRRMRTDVADHVRSTTSRPVFSQYWYCSRGAEMTTCWQHTTPPHHVDSKTPEWSGLHRALEPLNTGFWCYFD